MILRNKNNETIERGKSLRDEEIEIELFPMPHPNLNKQQFDVKIFFTSILTVDEEELNELKDYETAYMRIQDLSRRIRLKEFKKRVLGKCMFSLAPNMNVGLKFFNLIKHTKKPNAKFINRNTNKELKTFTKYKWSTTNESLYRSQIGTHFPVKDKKVMISIKDMKQIKHFEDPGMKLVGFKSRSSLKAHQNLRPSYFIYPDEKIMKGSSQTFHAMIKSLIKKDKYALVRFVPRECATMRFWALLPQEEIHPGDDPNKQYSPPGFHWIFLPFAEDSRDIEESLAMMEKVPKPEKEETRTAKLFIKNMTIDFDSRKFENPSIQRFYSGLQSMALKEDKPEEIQDTLEPDYEGMDKMKKVVFN